MKKKKIVSSKATKEIKNEENQMSERKKWFDLAFLYIDGQWFSTPSTKWWDKQLKRRQNKNVPKEC